MGSSPHDLASPNVQRHSARSYALQQAPGDGGGGCGAWDMGTLWGVLRRRTCVGKAARSRSLGT